MHKINEKITQVYLLRLFCLTIKKSMENAQNFTFIELCITLTLLSFFLDVMWTRVFCPSWKNWLKANSHFRWLGKSEGCAIANKNLIARR